MNFFFGGGGMEQIGELSTLRLRPLRGSPNITEFEIRISNHLENHMKSPVQSEQLSNGWRRNCRQAHAHMQMEK